LPRNWLPACRSWKANRVSSIQAKVYELQKLRCNLCGEVFTAAAPQGVGSQKYDATAGSMIALLKYGSGMPFNRNGGLQGSMGVPLPASTQWEIVCAKAEKIAPAYEGNRSHPGEQ
jgi:transposase